MLADPDFIARLARSDIQKSFPRVTLDPARGLVLLMSPARGHERASEIAGDAIKGMAALLEIPLVSLRSARWRKRSDPPNTGPEADCCFYVGDRARRDLAAEAESEATTDRFLLDDPPDLVVEVGVTHVDSEKLAVYQDRGVPECWQLDRDREGRTQDIRFVALPEARDPESLQASGVLPGVTPSLFAAAFGTVARQLDNLDTLTALRKTLREFGAISPPNNRRKPTRDVPGTDPGPRGSCRRVAPAPGQLGPHAANPGQTGPGFFVCTVERPRL